MPAVLKLCVWLFLAIFVFGLPWSAVAKKPGAGVAVGECKDKGLFGEAKLDAVIPLCDANYPGVDSKESWLVLFYTQDQNTEVGKYFDVQLSKIAMDFGNFASRGKYAAKGKAGKPQKHRKRIQFLADKYDFQGDLYLPKKGLSDTSPVVKVGAVCCDCSVVPATCPGKGLALRLIHGGKEINVEQDARKIPETVRGVFEAMGLVKPGEKLPEVFGVSENKEL
mmetsp:Transcript_110480/g.219656  ORF Transcript_110480/g.219656 Transcript_110480/m.219656 type:complete len:223 (+) Transcript_110480:67-735(+)|eukprot:CAMPEP_0172866876 /NCGR_PEP_ID=MMETSP1075-20121228/82238_1 /TAXON_ID=2916 /ORGANISM="Ceratium fusus, Strain PA161109" /LENGTH=222 /DNA_ID=CAMNT_0013716091 /DNA_START=64 /DNA_END=732 /DNA_ORIENTATION=-